MKSLRRLRKAKGLSQKGLAEQLKVHQSAVALWEGGYCNPRSCKLLEIAKILDCTVAELLEETQSEG